METQHGEFCGTVRISAGSNANFMGVYDVFAKKGHFGLVSGNKFRGFAKKSLLRKEGIYCPVTRKKLYGEHGYIGSTSKQKAE
jgi:hypothetical protein